MEGRKCLQTNPLTLKTAHSAFHACLWPSIAEVNFRGHVLNQNKLLSNKLCPKQQAVEISIDESERPMQAL